MTHGKPLLSFTEEEEAEGRRRLAEMGIDPSGWFVCIFARDSAYLQSWKPGKDWSYHDMRNSDIDAMAKAAKLIVDRGGHVVRMGYKVEKEFSFKHPKVIDYAVSHRSDFMDIYLPGKCRFVLGSGSGITDVATIFHVPKAVTNHVPAGTVPYTKDNIYLPKKVRSVATGELVPFTSFIPLAKDGSEPHLHSEKVFAEMGYRYEENTEEEIFELASEMLQRLDGTFKPSPEDESLMKSYFGIFPEGHPFHGVPTPVCLKFLKDNRALFGL